MIPRSTSNEIVYAETGTMAIDLTLKRNRIKYLEKIRNSNNSILQAIREAEGTKGWWKKTEETRKELVSDNWDEHTPIHIIGKKIDTAVKEKMMERIKSEGTNKTKLKYYLENKRNIEIGKGAKYTQEMTRMDSSIILQARSRMLDCKENTKINIKTRNADGAKTMKNHRNIS